MGFGGFALQGLGVLGLGLPGLFRVTDLLSSFAHRLIGKAQTITSNTRTESALCMLDVWYCDWSYPGSFFVSVAFVCLVVLVTVARWIALSCSFSSHAGVYDYDCGLGFRVSQHRQVQPSCPGFAPHSRLLYPM